MSRPAESAVSGGEGDRSSSRTARTQPARGPSDPDEIARRLQECRARTLLLVSSLDDEDLRTQHSPLMSPIVWDLGHVAHFEEVWLLERASGMRASADRAEGLRGIYNPFENPRSTRSDLELPSKEESLEYLAAVRRAVLDRLGAIGRPPASDGRRTPDPDEDERALLLRDDMVFDMVLQHEYQHNETILQTLQLKRGESYRAPRGVAAPDTTPGTGSDEARARRGRRNRMVRVPGGEVAIGTDEWARAYDNERPSHVRRVVPFWIDVAPVTGAEYAAFVEDGGYERDELWSREGRAWKKEEGAEAPAYWYREGSEWRVRVFDRHRAAADSRPVCHVSFHEAEAYARWAGKRLPTEFEWEVAAAWDPDGQERGKEATEARTGRRFRFPWGDTALSPRLANVDQLLFDTAPVWSYPDNVSPLGCYGMIGDVWEWTSSDFEGYPGFRSFPYREYSEVFFGSEYKVLRGGSWATRTGAVRTTFRNWDFPVRRQIFAGFRCARDDG